MTVDEMDRVIRRVKSKYPILANIALINVPLEPDSKIETAAVCGQKTKSGRIKIKCIKYNPDFMDNLTFSQQVFVMAHEIFHIALKHFVRGIDKPEKDIKEKYDEYCKQEQNETKRNIKYAYLVNKYNRLWNIATDACINAFLKKDGLEMPEGAINKKTGEEMHFVNIADGLFRRAEKIYDDLVAKEEERKQGNGSENGDTLDDVDTDSYKGFDSHDYWQGEENDEEIDDSLDPRETDEEIDETEVFKKNSSLRGEKKEVTSKGALRSINEKLFGNKDKVIRPIISWKDILRRNLESEHTVWGHRRSSRLYPNARIEDKENDEEKILTEIILDASGSISLKLLKEFLKQLYPLLCEGEVKVGFFADRFSGFTKISKKEDIDNLVIGNIGSGTDFEAAATSFSSDGLNSDGTNRVNKIVFTDGVLGGRQVTRVDDIIWMVFGDSFNFAPVGGKLIKVPKECIESIAFIVEQNQTLEIEESKGMRL